LVECARRALRTREAVARGAADPGAGRVDLAALAQLLFFSAGLTKRKVYPGGEAMHFRAPASTGALYQTEVYVVAGAVEGLEPGVYHFCPGDFTLRRLAPGITGRPSRTSRAGVISSRTRRPPPS